MPKLTAKLTAKQPPPPHYYADNLRQLLCHVQQHYADLLSAEERQLIEQVTALSSAGQRLFARLLGRKGPWLRSDRLHYDEVDNLPATLQELQGRGLIAVNGQAPADALLGLLTQPERHALFPESQKPRQRLNRHQTIQWCLGRYPDCLIAERIATRVSWICLAHYGSFHRCQLLFFGDARHDLTTFVLQDLGLRTFENYSLCLTSRQFADRQALDRYLRLLTLGSWSHRLNELEGLADAIRRSLTEAGQGLVQNRLEQRLRDKILNRLGRWFERRGDSDGALACYQASRRHPARERRVRLLKARDDEAGAQGLLEAINNQPWSAEEQDFADRCGQRRCHVPSTRISLGGCVPSGIEQHAMAQVIDPGDQAWHLENALPLGLTGLAYWSVIFAEVPGAFVNPFQSKPVDLFWDDFLLPRQAARDLREAQLRQDLAGVLRNTYATKIGINNRLVNWHTFTADVLEAALLCIPPAQLLRLVQYVLDNLASARVGFPDLFVARHSGGYEFVEVKGPTDQLQPAQRIWFKALAGLDMPARVLKFTP